MRWLTCFLKTISQERAQTLHALETICKSHCLCVILEGLVRWAGAQPKPELHLQSRFCPTSSGKWRKMMLHCHFSLFEEGESLSSTWKDPRSFTKVKPTAHIYIYVLVLPHSFGYLYKTRGFIPAFSFLKKKALWSRLHKTQIQIWIALSVLSSW